MKDFELNEMRQQMAILKSKLDQQEIVSEHLVRRSMKNTVSSVNRRNMLTIVIALLMIPLGYYSFVKILGLSTTFWMGTNVVMLVSAAATIYNIRRLLTDNLMRENLIDVRREVARAKKFDTQWLFFSFPIIVAWLAWFTYESWQTSGKGGLASVLFTSGIGASIGLIIGLRLYFKTQRDYQEVISQIEEVTAE